MAKMRAETFIFRKHEAYNEKIFQFIHHAERIDTRSDEFADILFDVKRRRISDYLVKIVTSPNVVFGIDVEVLPKAFRTFVAADPKDNNKIKAFIDVTGCVVYKDGVYVCKDLNHLISYVISAMVNLIYTKKTNVLTGNSSIIKDGGDAFMRCVGYIMDRMYKISSVQDLKKKLDYLSVIYYQVNLLGKDFKVSEKSIKGTAVAISDIDPHLARVVDTAYEETDFVDIDRFGQLMARVFGLKDFRIDNFVGMWMRCYGPGTVFAMEYLPAFSTMLTNTYVGGYLDQQATIEKITSQSMVKFVKTILQIGAHV